MAELTLIVLGDTPPRGIHWSRPGAIHQARWMARNLYSMKMFMFAEQLEYDEETVVKLERLNLFLGLFYTPMWMSSTLAADAPANDLQFMKDMMKFKRTDPEIAQALLQKLENHKWYLTQEVVPFALFGSRLSDKEKQDIAAKLHATEKPDSFRRGKPMIPQVTAKTTLADLFGPESHLLLDTLGIEYDWLLQPVATWPRSDDYSKPLEYVSNVKVVNDIAERGVKMMTDFANIITIDFQQKQYLLQTVEYNLIFAESLGVLVMALEALHEEAKPLGLEVSWLKTRVQLQQEFLSDSCRASCYTPMSPMHLPSKIGSIRSMSVILVHPTITEQNGQLLAGLNSGPRAYYFQVQTIRLPPRH
ncbi:hypothetical protein GWK47_003996 [Chionoecetes opilio]|uniref:Uncharacterized protein n=1 Tax=Chionoecetes opilio TaxID=41210 RepID=A0A8J4YIU0_CHIOP|nr:hypothetical protein GWK47_003996 [Chionoecetes opilio]